MRKQFICLAVVLIALGQRAFAANLIQDPGFETPIVVDTAIGYDRYSAGSTFGSWLVDSGNVDVTSTRWLPNSGNQSLDLDGAIPGAVSQTIPTLPGQKYQLSLYLAGNTEGGSNIKTMEILWNASAVATLTFNTTSRSDTNMGWSQQTLDNLVATGTSTTVEFESLDASDSGYGPVLDDVSVTAVPEPLAPMTLLFVVAFASLRRRRAI
jgi:choice-of-anchor C domain-containing protein